MNDDASLAALLKSILKVGWRMYSCGKRKHSGNQGKPREGPVALKGFLSTI